MSMPAAVVLAARASVPPAAAVQHQHAAVPIRDAPATGRLVLQVQYNAASRDASEQQELRCVCTVAWFLECDFHHPRLG